MPNEIWMFKHCSGETRFSADERLKDSDAIKYVRADIAENKGTSIKKDIPTPDGLHTNPDAYAWAKFYCEMHPDANLDVIHGWFANAMMAMHDHIMNKTKVMKCFYEESELPKVFIAIYSDGSGCDIFRKRDNDFYSGTHGLVDNQWFTDAGYLWFIALPDGFNVFGGE